MPGGSGFDLLDRLEDLPQVIFTTAYDQHAVRAFEVNALDYLLKPIDPERLATAVARLRRAPAVPEPGAPARADLRPGWTALLVRAAVRSAPADVPKATTCGCRGATSSRCSVAHWPASSNASIRGGSSGPIVARSSTWTSSTGVEIGLGGRLHVQLRDGPEVEISRRQARLFRLRTNV